MDTDYGTATLCEIAPPRPAALKEHPDSKPIHVLMVEDDPEAAELALAGLCGSGGDEFFVEWVPTLIEAMHRLTGTGTAVDVVLLDLGLPELTGYKSYRAIQASAGHDIPVVIFTSDDRPAIKQLIMDFGAAAYLVKSETSPQGLKQALRSAVLGG